MKKILAILFLVIGVSAQAATPEIQKKLEECEIRKKWIQELINARNRGEPKRKLVVVIVEAFKKDDVAMDTQLKFVDQLYNQPELVIQGDDINKTIETAFQECLKNM